LRPLVSVYDDARWPIDAPDAVDVLRYVMEQRNRISFRTLVSAGASATS